MTIKNDAFNKAIAILDALGCTYAVIDPDGKQIGNLKVAAEKRAYKSGKPYGYVSNYIRTHCPALKVGEAINVPVDTMDIAVFQRILSGYITKHYGAGTHMTAINRAKNLIEVLRIK